MNLADVRRLYAYTEWANAQIFAAADALSDEQYSRRIESSFPSISATLAHVISAEWIWLRRWKGESPQVAPDWAAGAPRPALHEKMREVEDERRELLDSLNEDALATIIAYRSIKGDPFAYPFADQLIHMANHSTYHRGQLTTMLRQVGAVPPATDWLVFQRTLK